MNKSLGFLATFALGALSASCLDRQTTVNAIRGAGSDASALAGPGAPAPGGGVISGSTPAGPQTFSISAEESFKAMELGDRKTVRINVQAGVSFNGTISLTIDRGDWLYADPQGSLSVTLTQSQLTLGPGASAQVMAVVSSDTTAPATSGALRIRAVATVQGRALPTLVTQLTVSVQPILTVKMLGLKGVARVANSPTHQDESYELISGIVMSGPFRVRPHALTAPLRIRFVNYDPAETHIIHAPGDAATELSVATGGTLPHGPTNLPLAASVNGQPGGTYEVTIRPETQQTLSFYCHRHDPDSSPHTLVLNYEIDKAKFASLNQTLIAPKCANCHGPGGPSPRLDGFANVSAAAGGGNPYRSSLFSSITGDRMPILGTTPTPFTADQKRLIWDWIALGAQNN